MDSICGLHLLGNDDLIHKDTVSAVYSCVLADAIYSSSMLLPDTDEYIANANSHSDTAEHISVAVIVRIDN